MKLVAGKIYIEWSEMLLAGVPEGTLKAANFKGTSGWVFTKDPDDSRKVLIAYDSLKEKYKNMVRLRLGDPYEAGKSIVIDRLMTVSNDDIDYLQNHRLPDGRKIPSQVLHQYMDACKVLRFLDLFATRDKAASLGFENLAALWKTVSIYIQRSNVRLPKDRQKLQARLAEYRSRGAQCVISAKFCNRNSVKVVSEVQTAVLLEMIAHHHQFEDVFIAAAYNKWAVDNNFKIITPGTVSNFRRQNLLEIEALRRGSSAWRNSFDKTVHRSRPSAPLLLVNSDDNTLDLYFIKETTNRKGHKLQDYYHRVTLYIVMDAYNDYPLGYAIGENQSVDLVKEAFLNAVHHVKELTGQTYQWHQIVADSWGLKPLRSFYEAQGVFTPPRTGNARSKVIEQAFGSNWHRMLRQYPNYAGHNITAKKQLNPDAIQRIKKDFPLLSDAPVIIEEFINRLRDQVLEKQGVTRRDMWLEGFKNSELSRKRELSSLNRLMIFGKRHSYTNTITKDGLIVTLNGQRMIYDVPAAEYRKHVGKTLNVAYDPYDMSSVAAFTDDESVQILCSVYQKLPMAIADMQEGDRTRLNVLLGEKRDLSQWVLDSGARRRELLDRERIDAESMLQAGVLIKELKGKAEKVYEHVQLNAHTDSEDPFDNKDYTSERLNQNTNTDDDL